MGRLGRGEGGLCICFEWLHEFESKPFCSKICSAKEHAREMEVLQNSEHAEVGKGGNPRGPGILNQAL
jgi:hypothetical protein